MVNTVRVAMSVEGHSGCRSDEVVSVCSASVRFMFGCPDVSLVCLSYSTDVVYNL